MIEQIVKNVGVTGFLLDRRGVVVSLYGDRATESYCDDPLLKVFPGDSYVKSCVSPDPHFIEVHRGLKDVLERRVDFFSTLYWTRSTKMNAWYILAAFPRAPRHSQTVVIVIDVSNVLKASTNLSARMVGRGLAASSQLDAVITNTIRRAISESLSHSRGLGLEAKDQPDDAQLRKLSKAQLELVGLLANGLSNTEIAEQRKVTVNTVKTQVADIIQKLGLSNRTQVALFAAKNYCVARRTTKIASC